MPARFDAIFAGMDEPSFVTEIRSVPLREIDATRPRRASRRCSSATEEEKATRPPARHRLVHRHPGLLVWDNLQTMYRGTPFDDTKHPRDMQRTTVIEEAADIA